MSALNHPPCHAVAAAERFAEVGTVAGAPFIEPAAAAGRNGYHR
jgi:hypothetical protein